MIQTALLTNNNNKKEAQIMTAAVVEMAGKNGLLITEQKTEVMGVGGDLPEVT